MSRRNMRAEKSDWVAAQLGGLLTVIDEEEYPSLYRYISIAYTDAYRSAAEIYEWENIGKGTEIQRSTAE